MQARLIIFTLLILALPPLGVVLHGESLTPYLQFPPVERYLAPAPYAWPAFAALCVLLLMLLVTVGLLAFGRDGKREHARAGARFPDWGWLGAGLLLLGLMLDHQAMLPRAQGSGLTLLLLGYVLLLNGLTLRRSGQCLLRDRPGYLLALVPVSGLLWWYMEYLNRFVQSWYFAGIAHFSALEYGLYTTLPFALVIPAVLSTRQWLATYPALQRRLEQGRALSIRNHEGAGILLFLVAAVGLMGAAAWPDKLQPIYWLAPVLLFTSLQLLDQGSSFFTGVGRGNWSRVVLSALAGLLVGLLLTFGNHGRPAHWVYDLPFIQHLTLFGLPLPGYAAFLALGILCMQVADVVALPWRNRPRNSPRRRLSIPIKVEPPKQ